MRRDPFEAVEKLKSIQPKYQPPTTKKMAALLDLRKKEREEKERKYQQKVREQEEREARKMTVTNFFGGLPTITNLLDDTHCTKITSNS